MTAGELLVRTLRAMGVGAIYGPSLEGLDVIELDARVAPIVARSHERVHGERAALHDGGGMITVASAAKEDPAPEPVAIEGPEDIVGLVDLVESVDRGESVSGLRLQLSLDLLRPTDVPPPVKAGGDAWAEPTREVLEGLEEVGAGAGVVVLCGPGVVRDRAVWGLHELAAAGGLGVLNTWGAKGVFDWRSPHHWATVGLQRDDFVLGGLHGAGLIVATGLDPLESPADRWTLGRNVSVEPKALASLADLWPLPRARPQMPPLRDLLGGVTTEGWEDERVPIAPTRATLSYSRMFASGGLVAADPGTAGFWVARTFATRELASVHVPAETDSAGSAVACCLVARLRSRTRATLAVIDAPVRPEVDLLLEAAARLGVTVPVEVWDPDGERLTPEEHEARLRGAAGGTVHGTCTLATDRSQLERIIEVAGPIVAWS